MSGWNRTDAPRWRRYGYRERAAALCVAAGVAAIVTLAYALEPDPRGLGTHEQLGLAPCRMLTMLGVPCPFCGMTTAFALAAHGNISTAFLVQPAGTVLFGMFLLVAPFALIVGAVGRGLRSATLRASSGPAVLVLFLSVCLAWIYKILTHAG